MRKTQKKVACMMIGKERRKSPHIHMVGTEMGKEKETEK